VVQDLPERHHHHQDLRALAAKLGRVEKIDLPDAEALHTNDGSIVLRRDTKVMLVDVASSRHVRQPAQPARATPPPDHEGRC
jgi:hypothetical protein